MEGMHYYSYIAKDLQTEVMSLFCWDTWHRSTPSTLSSVAHLWDLSVVVAWEHPAGRGLLEAQASPKPGSLRHELGLWSGHWLHSALMTLGCPPWLAKEKIRLTGGVKTSSINTVTCYFLSPCQMLHENPAQHCGLPGTSFASWKNEKYKTFEDMGVLTPTNSIF